MIIKAYEKHLDAVRNITQKTITEIYPKYYPSGAVEFFINHHNDDSIMKDIHNGSVYILCDNGKYVGTVTVSENEIKRLFVLTDFQHKGYGNTLLDFAENEISKNYSEIILDSSLSAKEIYIKRGYTENEYHRILTPCGDYLCYDVMKKRCDH